jgi:16S rRNA processing protein RimM
VVGAKGLAGALRVEVLTDRPERLTPGALLYVEGEDEPRRVSAVEAGGRLPIIQLEGIGTREGAEALRGSYLEVEAEPLPKGSFYWHQIVGLQVQDEAGTPLGSVVEVFRAGENEVYRVESDDGVELLLPALRHVILAIDPEAGTMTVHYEVEEVR